jgi:uncharacterized membrane protein YeaQ/YmgE (transglycosylase-associated protein family)
MDILYWIVFGLIAGTVANFIMPSSRGGILASLILGIVGAIVGGYLGKMFFGVGVTGFNLSSFVVAVLGAILVLFVGSLLMRNQS